MQIDIKKHQGTIIAEVAGELDGKTAPEMLEVVSPLLLSGKAILLDLTRTTYMSSAGLRTLLLLYREASAQLVQVVLVGVCHEIKDVMATTGFLKFFQVAETLDEVAPAGSPRSSEGSHP